MEKYYHIKTYTAQFRLPGNIGISKLDPDSEQVQQQLAAQISRTFQSGEAKLTSLNEFFTELDDHAGETSEDFATFVDINLYLNDAVGANYKQNAAAITKKAIETLNNSKMFLSYLWKRSKTEHIGLETFFV